MAMKYTIPMTLAAKPDGTPDPDAGTEVKLLCDYTAGLPGSFYTRNGDPGDPPEPDEVVVNSVILNGVTLAADHPLTLFVDGQMEDDEFYEKVIADAGEIAMAEKAAAIEGME